MNLEKNIFTKYGAKLHGSKHEINSISSADIISMLHESGVIIFENFDLNLNEFKQFSDRVFKKYMTHMGVYVRNRIDDFRNDLTITEVTKGKNEIHLHGEMYHSPVRPNFLWFFCEEPPAFDGQTTIADGVELYNLLPKSIIDLFKAKNLRYSHVSPPQVWRPQYDSDDINEVLCKLKNKAGVTNISINGEILIYDYTISAFNNCAFTNEAAFINNINIAKNPANELPREVTSHISDGPLKSISIAFDDGTNIPSSVIEEINIISKGITNRIQWKKSQFALIDNSRILHGRDSFNSNRIIATRLAM